MGGVNATGGRLARVPALDGIRGLAVAAVVAFHAEAGVAPGGFLGVSAFFTLSGFLITSLLLAERRATGRIALGAFWARRARRLLPAAAVAIAGILLFGATVADADQVRDLRGDVLAALGYAANWRFLADGRAYSELFSSPSPVQHFWSLAIEEQFYVVFPLLVVGALKLGRGRARVLRPLLALGSIGSIVLGRALSDDAMRVYYGTDTRVAELLVGAVLAVVCANRAPSPARPAARLALDAAGFVSLGVLVWWWTTVGQGDHWLYEGGFALHALLTATVIGAARADTLLATVLALRPLAGLGLVSYGVYLYHWPLFLWLTPERVDVSWGALLALRCGLTLGVAIASYHFVERPIRHGARLRGAWPRVLTPAVSGALVGALVLVTASPPAPSFVLESLAEAPSLVDARAHPRGPLGAARGPDGGASLVPSDLVRPYTDQRPLRVLVVGDSVGLTFGRGVELWAAETGAAVVRNEAREWCSLGRDLPQISGIGGKEEPGTGCHDWEERWGRTVDEFDPDVVFVMFTIWEVAPRRLPGAADYTRPGDPAHDAWQLSEYHAAADVLSRRGARVAWFNLACNDAPIPRGEPIWQINERTLPALVATHPAVRLVDINAELCPGGEPRDSYDGVQNFRPDNAHFSDEGALAVARWVMRRVARPTEPQVQPVALRAAQFHRPLGEARPMRILVVGDSVGVTFGRGLELWAAQTDRAVVRNEARTYCSVARYAPRIVGMQRGEQGDRCDDWERRWARVVDDFDPDMVVVMFTIWEAVPRQVPGADEFVDVGDPRYDAWQFREYEAAAEVLSRRGAPVVWLTIPCDTQSGSGRGTPIWSVNRTIRRLSYAHPAVRVVDLDAELCPGATYRSEYRGVDPARPDGRHFSDAGALATVGWLMQHVVGIV